MKILFVTRGFPSEKDPMSGNYEAVQARALAAKGIQVSVVAVQMKSFKSIFRHRGITHRIVDGIEVYECTGLRLSTRFLNLSWIDDQLRKRKYLQVFKRYVKEQGLPDLVHAHIIFCGYAALFFKNEYNIPVILTEHWSKTFTNKEPHRLQKLATAYREADKLICVSQALADSIKRSFHVNSLVINNMVSNLFFESQKVLRNDGLFKFISVGAFRQDKCFDLLVQAFAHAHFPKTVTLDIIGDGEEYEFVKGIIKESEIADQVNLLGTKTPEEVSTLLCHSDCYVLSSRVETFSIVVIEAMAKGLPVIATKCGGPETFLRPEHGILVEKENVEQLAQAMKSMVEHHDNYNGESIRQFCYNHFSQDVIANQIIDVYNQVLTKK